MKNAYSLKKQRGFTFVLALISVIVVGITATSVITLWSTSVKREKETEMIYRLDKVRTALKNYKQKYNRYPSHIEELLVDRYVRNSCLIDPITGKEWATVTASYTEGLGIKDIHSSSEETAIKTKAGNAIKHSEF